MASQKELLSVTGKQEPMVPANADVKDMGGPTTQWSTADYANFKFDAAIGVSPDTTILPKAGVSGEPMHKMSEEDDDPSDEMEMGSEEMKSEDEPKELPEEEDDAKKVDDKDDEDDKDEKVLAELDGEDEDVLDLDLADLADDDTEMVELGGADVEEVSDTEDDTEMNFSTEEDEMTPAEADEDEMKKQPFAEAWKKMKEEDGDENDKSMDDDSDDAEKMVSEEEDTEEHGEGDENKELVAEEEGDEDDDEDKLSDEEDELKKAEDEMMSEGKIRVSFKFDEANRLFESNQSLTEEEKLQSRRLFEAAVRGVAQEIGAKLHETYSTRYKNLKSLQERKFAHAKKVMEAKTAKQIDQYMNYVVEQWMNDNKTAVRTQLRNKLSENFILGLKDLFMKHYIDVPQSRVNVVEALAKNVKTLKQQVRESEARAVKLHTEMKAAVKRERQALVREHRARLIVEAASVLPAAERGQFAKRAESLAFTNTKNYKKDLVALREQHFGAKTSGERPMNVPDAAPLFESKQTSKTPVNAYIKAAEKIGR